MGKRPTFGPLNPEPKSRVEHRARVEQLKAQGLDPLDFAMRTPVPMEPVLAKKDRLTANLIVHHEHLGDSEPTSFQGVFSELLETNTIQPYKRRLVVPNTWEPLDLGSWFKSNEVGFVVLENRQTCCGGEGVQPTPEQAEALRHQLLMVSFRDNILDLLVRPGRFVMFEPECPKAISIKAQHDSVTCMIYIFPR